MSHIKGDLGEDRVKYLLTRLDKNEYRVGSNITLIDDNYNTFNIDHIVISIYGLFVIETKNLHGEIRGSDSTYYWSQNIDGKTFQFYNPVKQNFRHIKRLEQIFTKGMKIISIICFTERAEVQSRSKFAEIVKPLELVGTIQKYRSVVYTKEQINYMVDKINRETKKYRKIGINHGGLMDYYSRLYDESLIDEGYLRYVDNILKPRLSPIWRYWLDYVDNSIKQK